MTSLICEIYIEKKKEEEEPKVNSNKPLKSDCRTETS